MICEPEREPEREEALTAIGALGEPTRRALYTHIVDDGSWVSREAAADAVGIERATAAHHLDRLAADGLLEVDYRRLTGRQGPGAGRPAKLYRRARRELDVSLPPRAYALAGHILAEAADRSRREGTGIVAAIDAVAHEAGQRIADTIGAQMAPADKRRTAHRRKVVIDALAARGFEPETSADGVVILRNCPFHQLSQRHTELICGLNHCLLDAVIEGVADTGLSARLEPADGFCCVRLHPTRKDS